MTVEQPAKELQSVTPVEDPVPTPAGPNGDSVHTNSVNGFLLASFFVDQLPRMNEALLNRSLGYDLGEENIHFITNAAYLGIGIGAICTGSTYLLLPLAAAYTNNLLNGQGFEYKKSLYEYLGINNYYGRALDIGISASVVYMQLDSTIAAAATLLFDGVKLSSAYLVHDYQDYNLNKIFPAMFQAYSDAVVSMVMFTSASALTSKIAIEMTGITIPPLISISTTIPTSGIAITAGIMTAAGYASELYWTLHDKPAKIDLHVHKPVNCICAQQDSTPEPPTCQVKVAGDVLETDGI